MMNKTEQIHHLEKAIKELSLLGERADKYTRMPYKYVHTIMNNTVGLLTAPTSALDGKKRVVICPSERNWRSLMRSVHGSFLSGIHIAVEKGLSDIIEEKKFKLRNHRKEKIQAGLDEIDHLPQKVLDFIDKEILSHIKPGFKDILDTVLQKVNITRKEKSKWRNFFFGLTIARNKVSHSNSILTKHDKETLRKGGLEILISPNSKLLVTPEMYFDLSNNCLNFFDVIYSNMN